jgi:hypothetical protein
MLVTFFFLASDDGDNFFFSQPMNIEQYCTPKQVFELNAIKWILQEILNNIVPEKKCLNWMLKNEFEI